MKLLKQNYHGLPGIGINGQTGQTGDRGNSIYFGFINDFFDGDWIGIDTYVYIAKRLINDDGEASDIVDKTLLAAWKTTLAELYQYKNNALNTLVFNSSNDLTNPYINYKTFYYTGNRLSSIDMLNSSMINALGGGEAAQNFINESANAIKLDINGDYISMSFMLLSANNSNRLKDISLYNFDKDYTVEKPLNDPDSISLQSLYLNIESKITHYEFNSSAAISMDASYYINGLNTEYHIPYNTDDIIYYNNPNIYESYETGNFLDNINCSNYYEYYDNTDVTYVKQNIKYPFENDAIASMDSNIYNATITINGNNYEYNLNRTGTKFIGDNVSALSEHWETLFKTSEKINKNELIDEKRSFIENGDLLDADENAFFGIPDRILFTRNSTDMTHVNNSSSIIPLEFENYFNYDDQSYSDYVTLLLISSSDGSKIYYTLNENERKVFIPSTLKNIFKVGDILYFYKDQIEFNENLNIEYMVVITEDLLNCTPTQLISAALLQNPLNTNLFSNIDNRLISFHNTAILYDQQNNIINNKLLQLSNKSYISIVDEYSKSPLILCSSNAFASLNASINGYNKYMAAIINDNQFIFNANDVDEYSVELPQLKINNLCVNTTNLTSTTNVELHKMIYNSNIILYENNFIKPLLDLDLYHDNVNDLLSVFIQNINAKDYFYDINNLDNYFYGCDIYNKDMEKIKTITSISENLNIEIIPNVNNNVYYILMFASCGSSLKYYSKLTRLSIKYSKIELDKITPMALPNGYASPIGKYSTKTRRKSYNNSVGNYSNRQLIIAFWIDIIGEEQQIIKEKLSGNIIFNISNITSEEINGGVLEISTNNNDILIESILFNHQDISDYKSNWSNITNLNDNYTYRIDMSTNLPKFNGEESLTFSKFAITGSSTNENPTSESPLFTNLKDNIKTKSTKSRSILVTVQYRIPNSYDYYYENFNIVQPGFEDTRDLPIVKLNTHSNITDLQTFNSIENNILSNQFVTYLDIDITDFKKQWGKFANDTSISLDIQISNLLYDLDWLHSYVVKELLPRRTFRYVYNKNDIKDTSIINNYVKFKAELINTTLLHKDINISLNSLLYNNDTSIMPTIINDNSIDSDDNNGKYIIFDSCFNDVLKNSKFITTGLLNNIVIDLKNISLNNDYDKVRIKLLTEFGNPIIANMYYRFYVKNMSINVDIGETSIINGEEYPVIYKFYTLVPTQESLSENANPTYLCKVDKISYTNDKIVDLKYKYISDPIDVTFNPLSYTITPNDIESSYTNIYGDIYKCGIKELIIKELKFFNSSVYSSPNFINLEPKEIRENAYYDFKNLLIKKSYILDNVKNINVKPVSLYKLINNIDTSSYKSIKIDEQLKTHNVLDFIEGNKYLGIVYHSNIMLPKVRNSIYTFYYNNKKYIRTKYDLKNNNLPVFVYDEQSIELRDDILLNSMDKWNGWYTKNYSKTKNTYTGILSLYGNGYTLIYESDIKDIKDVSFYSNTFTGIIESSGLKKSISLNKEESSGLKKSISLNKESSGLKKFISLNKESSGKYDVSITLSLSSIYSILDINEVKSLNNVYINEYSLSNEINVNPMKQTLPNNGEYFRGFLYDINWEFPYYNKNAIVPYRIVSPFDNFLKNNVSRNGHLTDDTSIYETYYEALTDLSDASYGTHMVPYTLLYDIEPRIAYNYETKGINVFMLRRPSIGVDTDIINSSDEFKQKYEFNRRLFNIENFKKLTSPYTIK